MPCMAESTRAVRVYVVGGGGEVGGVGAVGRVEGVEGIKCMSFDGGTSSNEDVIEGWFQSNSPSSLK